MNYLHMSGAGNDFAVLDARGKQLDFEKLAIDLCQKLQADGFMALDDSDVADFRLHFYNSDGTRGEMCGNGARCICKFAYDHGIAGAEMTVQTDAGLVKGWRQGENLYKVQLNNPSQLVTDALPGVDYVELGDPGVPHGVYRFEGLTWEMRDELRERMRAERYADYFPKGANVNYYDFLAHDRVRILTFERGVEDFTLACGTGSGSVAVVLCLTGRLPGGKLAVENPGGTLEFALEGTETEVTSILMTGPAQRLGEYEI